LRQIPLSLCFASAGDGRLAIKLLELKIEMALLAARGFKDPEGLGYGPFEGAAILVLDPSMIPEAAALMDSQFPQATERLEIEGVQVAFHKEKVESDDWTFYLARPRPNVLVSATDRSFLAETLSRMSRQVSPRAFPMDLPQWKHIDPSAQEWALRRYSRRSLEDREDPDPAQHDPKAQGFVFHLSPDGYRCTLRYFTANPDTFAKMKGAIDSPDNADSKMKYLATEVEPGVIELTMIGKDLEGASSLSLLLISYLGFQIVI
jgi:hypothetical protein